MKILSKRFGLVAVLAPVGVAAAIALAPAASAHSPQPTISARSTSTIVVTNWKTSLQPGVSNPKTSSDVTWPQSYIASVPACHDFWIQQDQWTKDAHSQDEILRLINGGVLTKGADDWFQVPGGWKFLPPVPCSTPSAPSTPKTTPVVAPVSPSTPVTPVTVVSAVQTPVSPSGGVGTGVATALVTPPTSPGSAPQLAQTGFDRTLWSIIGGTLLSVGAYCQYFGRRRGNR